MLGNSVVAGSYLNPVSLILKCFAAAAAVVVLLNNISASLILGSESQVTNKPVLSGFVVNSN